MKQLYLYDNDSSTVTFLKSMINVYCAELDLLEDRLVQNYMKKDDVLIEFNLVIRLEIARVKIKIDSLIRALQLKTKKIDLQWDEVKPDKLVERREEEPTCFKSKPGPQAQAENGCENCNDQNECLK